MAPGIPTFHGFSTPHNHELAGAQARRVGTPWLCPAGSAERWLSASPSLLWGLTQHPADKGMSGPEVLEILQCFATCDVHGVSPFASHSLSHPLCLCSLLATPELLPYSEIRENVLFSECPSKEGETFQAGQDLVLPH